MGAMPWQGMGPWREDPSESLRALQAEYLAANSDLQSIIQRRLEAVREAIRLSEADPDGNVERYRIELATLEWVSRQPIPDDSEARIAVLRVIDGISNQGIVNVLDVKSASTAGGVLVSRILTQSELDALFGTTEPTREMAKTTLDKLESRLGRGESVCFPVYDKNGKPEGWWFAGYSVD